MARAENDEIKMDPGFRRDDEVGAFAGMTKQALGLRSGAGAPPKYDTPANSHLHHGDAPTAGVIARLSIMMRGADG